MSSPLTEYLKSWPMEFEEKFKCINAESLGCDSKGNIPVQVGEGEWEAEQCQYCFEVLFKQKDWITHHTTTVLHLLQEELAKAGRHSVTQNEIGRIISNLIK